MSFCLPIRPTTKKTSSQIVSFGKPCWTCKKRPLQKVVPSEIFLEFEAACVALSPKIRHALEKHGVQLPIMEPVSINAQFYREVNQGDWNGFTTALADVLQEPRWKNGKQTRKGMGIIADDVLIRDWDGTRLLKDAARPRIEICITTVDPPLFSGAKA